VALIKPTAPEWTMWPSSRHIHTHYTHKCGKSAQSKVVDKGCISRLLEETRRGEGHSHRPYRAMAGLMVPEAAAKYAGEGLASVCEAVGIPPVLHMGSCVDNSRILIAGTAMVKDGGLGDDISDLPVAGAAPEWMSEKAISIGQYFVASGVFTVFGVTWPTEGSKEVTDYLFKDMEEMYGGMWAFEPDPIKAAQLMIAHIDKKRKALGIDKARERVLYDMEMRRELEAV